jgi:hypothetical protein
MAMDESEVKLDRSGIAARVIPHKPANEVMLRGKAGRILLVEKLLEPPR